MAGEREKDSLQMIVNKTVSKARRHVRNTADNLCCFSFCSCDKYYDQQQLGLQGGKPRQKPGDWNKAETAEHSFLLGSFRSTFLSYVGQAYPPRYVIPHSGPEPPTLICNQENAPTVMSVGQFSGRNSLVEVPSFQMCQADN